MMKRIPGNLKRLRPVLEAPFSLHLEPTFLSHGRETGNERQLTIYVEPPNAPGIRNVLATLRKKLRCDRPVRPKYGFLQYSRLAGGGIHSSGATSSVAEPGFYDETDWPMLRASYRLILARGFEPIGYCTFFVELADLSTVNVEVDEVWIEKPHRSRGLGAALATKTAQIVRGTLLELDDRLASLGVTTHELLVLVHAEVYSSSGAGFLFQVSDGLEPVTLETRAVNLYIQTET
jgi:GNAT superfamily N-acetyltransferase